MFIKGTCKTRKAARLKAEKLAEKLAESKMQFTDITAVNTVVILEHATVR